MKGTRWARWRELPNASVNCPTVKLNPQFGSAYACTGASAAYVVVVITGDGNVNGVFAIGFNTAHGVLGSETFYVDVNLVDCRSVGVGDGFL